MTAAQSTAPLTAARVHTGDLEGVPSAAAGVTVFRGIPFAAPPVGPLRWRPPEPPAAWQGVRRADTFGPICPQLGPPPGSFYDVEFYQQPEPQSEDCLYLNVWTGAADASERRPVMVWFHGGGFVEGSGSLASFGGETLAGKGVVLVTANYRLGALGYLAHPALSAESERGVSGNYGLLDQVAALRWVRQNIAAFGGDPDNVTIFGQSAGSISVFALSVSPLAAGLFKRAIGQSGSPFSLGRVRTLAEVEAQGQELGAAWGAATAEELRALPPSTLLGQRGGPGVYGMAVDGWAIAEHPTAAVAAGRHHAQSLLVGGTADEWTPMGRGAPASEEGFRAQAAERYGAEAGEMLGLYPAAGEDEVRLAMVATGSDQLFAGQRMWALAQAAQRPGAAFVYFFERRLPGRDSEWYGAFHSGDLYYAFGTLGSTERPWEDADRRLADAMTSYWASFAATGDPNTPGLPRWPAFDPQDGQVMRLGAEIGAGTHPRDAGVRFFQRALERSQPGS